MRAPKLGILASFAVIYLVWGSTFLAIQRAVHEIPPFVVGSLRFVTAGLLLLLVARRCSPRRLSAAGMRTSAIAGVLLAGVGNGSVIFAERTIPSGLASLWIAAVPVWILLLDSLFFSRRLPSIPAWVGALVGCAGIGLLPGVTAGAASSDWLPMAVLILGTLGWSVGTLVQRRRSEPGTALHAAAVQATSGGIALTLAALVTGQWGTFFAAPPSAIALGSVAFLSIGGTALAYTAYSWLLGVVEAPKVATYALVNPVVALILGAWLNGEKITPDTVAAGGLVLSAVALILWQRRPRPAAQGTEIPEALSARATAVNGNP